MSVYKYVNTSVVVSGDMLKICQFSFSNRYIYSLLYHYVMCAFAKVMLTVPPLEILFSVKIYHDKLISPFR